jgi:hypothetical protein
VNFTVDFQQKRTGNIPQAVDTCDVAAPCEPQPLSYSVGHVKQEPNEVGHKCIVINELTVNANMAGHLQAKDYFTLKPNSVNSTIMVET